MTPYPPSGEFGLLCYEAKGGVFSVPGRVGHNAMESSLETFLSTLGNFPWLMATLTVERGNPTLSASSVMVRPRWRRAGLALSRICSCFSAGICDINRVNNR